MISYKRYRTEYNNKKKNEKKKNKKKTAFNFHSILIIVILDFTSDLY
jgi:hypothetical protein